VQISAVTFEELMLLRMQHDVQVAGWPAKYTRFAFARVQHALSVFDAGGNLHCDRTLAPYTSLPFAFWARIDNQLARSLAGAAWPLNRKEPLLVAYLPASSASRAINWSLPRSRATSLAHFAFFQPPDRDLPGDAEDRFLELERNVFAPIGAALCARAAASAAAKDVAKVEKIAKDVLKISERRRIESDTAIVRHACMTEAVIARALLGVGKYGVGLAALLKLLFCLRIIGIAIGMVLHRQFAVGALDLLIAGVSAHAEDFVIIAFYVGSQCCFPYSI